MSGYLNVFQAGVFQQGTDPAVRWGSLVTSVKEVEVTPKLIVPPTIYTVAVGEKVLLWTYDADRPSFSYAGLWLPDQSGNVDVGVKFVASSDMSSNPRWRTHKLSCHTFWELNEDEALVHPTVATDVGDSAGFPALWGDGSTVAAKVSALAVYNPSTASAAVRVGFVLIGG